MKREETEVKLAIADASAADARVRAAGFGVIARRIFEQNLVLDTPALSLRDEGLLLRVRKAGDLVTCTFKGREIPGPHKRREEREFRASDFDEALAVFAGLGYTPRFRYEKYRTEYARAGDPGHVTIDETPVGAFIELEGTAEWIDATAQELGFNPKQYILASYGRIYADWRREHPNAPEDMVFRAAG